MTVLMLLVQLLFEPLRTAWHQGPPFAASSAELDRYACVDPKSAKFNQTGIHEFQLRPTQLYPSWLPTPWLLSSSIPGPRKYRMMILSIS
jgi:hypothetical protein